MCNIIKLRRIIPNTRFYVQHDSLVLGHDSIGYFVLRIKNNEVVSSRHYIDKDTAIRLGIKWSL